MRASRIFAFVGFSAAASCVVEVETSGVGKPCPCPEGLVCDDSGSCAEAASEPPCEPKIIVANFRAAWTTPESIRWQWLPRGEPQSFSAYRVVVGDNADFTGETRVFDSAINAELASYISEDEHDDPRVDFTVTDAFESDRDYYARLEATDVLGCVFTSETAEARTRPAPTESLPLFEDVPTGYLAPCGMTPVPSHDDASDDYLECSNSGSSPCLTNSWESLILGITTQLVAVPPEALASGQAFLELSVAVQSNTPAFYSEISLMRLEDGCTPGATETCQDGAEYCCQQGPWFDMHRVRLRASTEPDPAFQKIQIPLNALVPSRAESAVVDLLSQGVCGLRVGSEFLNATEVRLDNVAVRW